MRGCGGGPLGIALGIETSGGGGLLTAFGAPIHECAALTMTGTSGGGGLIGIAGTITGNCSFGGNVSKKEHDIQHLVPNLPVVDKADQPAQFERLT